MSDYYDPSGLDLRVLLRSFRTAITKNWLTIGLVSVACGAAAYLLTLTMEPEYKATAVMHVAQRDNGVFDLRELLMRRRDPAFQATQVGILQSRKLVEQVVVENDLHQSLAYSPGTGSILTYLLDSFSPREPATEADQLSEVVEDIRKSLNVRVQPQSYLVDVQMTSTDPELATLIVNALSNAYIAVIKQQEREDAIQSQNWLLERIESVRVELQEAEIELQRYKEQENIVGDSGGSRQFSSQEREAATNKFNQSRDERLALESLYRQIQAIEQGGGDLLTISQIQTNAGVQSVKNEILQLEKRVSELSRRYGPEHRRMVELRSELESTYDSLALQTERVVSAIKTEYELAVRAENQAKIALDEYTQIVQDLNRKSFRLVDLEQHVKTRRDIYEAFLEKFNKSQATGENLNTNVRLVDPATVPRRPESNKSSIIILLAMMLASLMTTAIFFIREWFDASIFTSRDIEQKLGQHAMGEVPNIEQVKENGDDPEVDIAYEFYAKNAFSAYAESIRSLRTAIMLSGVGKQKQRVLVTSTVPGEGKTSIAIGLANAFSQIKRTLLIDADLRRPSLQSIISDDDNQHLLGLTDLCVGGASDEECIHRIENSKVDILPAGTVTPNPQELFCSPEFAALITRLSGTYDYIVFDSPPCGALSDAHVLGAHVDQLLYIVKSGETPIQLIRGAIQRLTGTRAPIKGVVLNRSVSYKDSYSYRYSNYYNEQAVGAASGQ